MQNVELTHPLIVWSRIYDGNANWKRHIHHKRFTDEQRLLPKDFRLVEGKSRRTNLQKDTYDEEGRRNKLSSK